MKEEKKRSLAEFNFIDVDEVRDDFLLTVRDILLSDDETHIKEAKITEAFDALPVVALSEVPESVADDLEDAATAFEEDIQKVADNKTGSQFAVYTYQDGYRDGLTHTSDAFIAGARWDENKVLNKVIAWLNKKLSNQTYHNDKVDSKSVIALDYETKEEFIFGLKKYFEKGEHQITLLDGDWIVNKNGEAFLYYRDAIDPTYSHIEDFSGYSLRITTESAKRNYRLWTPDDAKTGDVLCTYEAGCPKIIFIMSNETAPKNCVFSYFCYYNLMYPHFDTYETPGCLGPARDDVKPATKEQREKLFEEIEKAGYNWRSDILKLVKLD